MKISKLKYVFAFVLLVAMSVISTNVQAVTMPNNGQIKLSTIVASQLAAIVDGDDPSTQVVDKTVKSFNTSYNTTILGTTMNPVQAYTLKVKSSGASIKAYSLTVGNIATQDAEFDYAGTSSNVRVGLGLAFGLNNSLSAAELDNQAVLSEYAKAYSHATQVYVWLANAGALGTASEEAAKATLNGTEVNSIKVDETAIISGNGRGEVTFTASPEKFCWTSIIKTFIFICFTKWCKWSCYWNGMEWTKSKIWSYINR